VVSDSEISADLVTPADVADPLLWRDAQEMLGRHSRANRYGECVWCARTWPCPPRRLAERAEAAAYRSTEDGWTDLASRPARHAARNAGPFDPPTFHPR